jgi:hypothetical protein
MGHIAGMLGGGNEWVTVGMAEIKIPPVRPGPRWVDNIKLDFGEIGCAGKDWIDPAQGRDWGRLMWT